MNQPQEAGRVLLFTGDGKGKTTAALGLACGQAGTACASWCCSSSRPP